MLSLLVVGLTQAAVSVKIVETDVPDEVFGGGFVTYDVLVSADEELRVMSLQINLDDGGVIHNVDPPIAILDGNLRLWDSFPDNVPLQYDTFVDMPITTAAGGALSNVDVLGRALGDTKPFDPDDPDFEPDPANFGPNGFSVTWGSRPTVDAAIVDYLAARVTVSGRGSAAPTGAALTRFGVEVEVGTIITVESTPSNPEGQETILFGGNLAGGELQVIPEPGTLAVMAGIGMLMIKRRRIA